MTSVQFVLKCLLVKNTSGIEVVINNAYSFVDLLWRPKVFVKN
jgi:hypothetical protein